MEDTKPTEQTTLTPTDDVQFTESQSMAQAACVDWALDADAEPQTKILAGPAGTGKTHLIAAIVDSLKDKLDVAVSSVTGKAVAVLRNKGIKSAQTLHSLLYNPVEVNGQLEFRPVVSIPYDLVIVDESSMISSDLLRDLLYHKVKVLFVGDPAQLEPIGDNPNLMEEPDIVLTEIHRQAKGSPIIQFATILRGGGYLHNGFKYGTMGDLKILPHNYLDEHLFSVDQVICGFNKTRHSLNARIREYHKRTGQLAVGERLICLKNNRTKGVYNGMMLTVDSFRESAFSKSTWIVTGTDELGTVFNDLPVSKKAFGADLSFDAFKDKEVTYWDYGYCITAHKAQGSQWKSVLVLEELAQGWNPPRWRYTACTRAQEKLVYLT